jgi:phosphatidylserine/phosphatidylglycerophosphate/cardiolipin synthase-like enzyme
MSHVWIGALKLAAVRVPVYGWASDVEGHARVELTEYPTESPQLHARVVPTQTGIDAPHQKLVIIDGLLAFKGSTNLADSAMRKPITGWT